MLENQPVRKAFRRFDP